MKWESLQRPVVVRCVTASSINCIKAFFYNGSVKSSSAIWPLSISAGGCASGVLKLLGISNLTSILSSVVSSYGIDSEISDLSFLKRLWVPREFSTYLSYLPTTGFTGFSLTFLEPFIFASISNFLDRSTCSDYRSGETYFTWSRSVSLVNLDDLRSAALMGACLLDFGFYFVINY